MMPNRLKTGIATVVALSFVVLLVISNSSAGIQSSHLSSSSSPMTSDPNYSPGDSQIAAVVPSPGLVLHSIRSVTGMFNQVNRSLILPSSAAVAAIDPSLRLVGFRIDNSSPASLEVTVYYSNQTFVNGSTTIQELVGTSGFEIDEAPAPKGVNSSEVAQGELNQPPPEICHTTSGVSQCQTAQGGAANIGSYIVSQNGLSIVVNPSGNTISWTDARQLMNVGLGGSSSVSIGQLLGMAATMTSDTS